MATVKRPPTFDPNHRNRAVIEAGGTAPASGALVSRTDRLREDLGFDEGNLPLSDSGEEEDEADEDPRARPSGEAALKQKISRLEQELDDLAGKLSKAEKMNSTAKQSSKAMTTLLNKRSAETLTTVCDAFAALIKASETGSGAAEAARLAPELEKFRAQASAWASQGLSDADVSLADAMALRGALKEAEDANAALIRRVKTLEIDLCLPESVRASGAAATPKAERSEELGILRSRVSTLEQQLRDTARLVQANAAAGSAAMPPPPPPAPVAAPPPAPVKAASSGSSADKARADELAAELERTKAELAEARAEIVKAEEAAVARGGADIAKKYEAREEKLKKKAAEQFEELKRNYEARMVEQKGALEAQMATLEARAKDSGKNKQALRAQAKSLKTSLTAVRKSANDAKSVVQSAVRDFNALFTEASRSIPKRVQSFADSYESIVENYRKEQKERKRLFNLVQELRGNIRVFCRVRPMLGDEVTRGDPVCVNFSADGEIAVTNSRKQRKSWEFDQVFQPGTSNETVFNEIAPLLTSVLDGFNVCIFAYGQTGSGKTFTMEGGGTPETRGMNYRALDCLFQLRDERAVDTRFEVTITLLEIYNEEIRDMLKPLAADAVKLSVKESKDGMYVPGITEVPVNSSAEVLSIMRQGYRNRTTFATDMNEHSSRSHCMLSVYVNGVNTVTGLKFKGKLHLIDLAGSERLSKSGAVGARAEEAKNINKSLSALGDVIQARAQKQAHVPFRNSTLTFLLKDSLSNDSKTLMFVNMSPALAQADESSCSLTFASRVRSVELGMATKHVSAGSAAPSAAPSPAATSPRK